MPYIPFTNEQKILANSVDLEQFLRMRGEKLERVGREHKLIYYDSYGRHDSITINGSTWFDHKNQIGGGAIKFMQEFYDMDFQTAVQELLGQTVTPLSHSPPKVSAKEEKKEFRLPEPNSNMHRVYAYLIKQRFIAPQVITHFAKQHTLYEDKEHHNAVFVGLDENGVPRQAHKRSTSIFGNSFRITCQGSDTRYSFAHFGELGKLFVFEAPIDMLSFLTLYPKDWQKHSYIVMNGLYENAVLTALKNHSNLTEIVLCVDNDEGGIEAVDRLGDILAENGYTDVKRLAPEYAVLVILFIAFMVIVELLDNKSLNGIKAKKVGNGQHGTARWATKAEIKRAFVPLPFEPEMWRKGQNLPTVQGTVVGCRTQGKKTVALVDDGDVHTLMIGAAGVGKTAYFLYPNIELACASGMSFISMDTKGDVARNYGTIASKYYGYNISVLDLRNPTRSDENNILHLVNKYMDMYLEDKSNLSAKAKAEKYAKITAKTIINIGGGDGNYGQNAFFYDAAEGLLSSVILLLAEFGDKNERHIVSVFKLIQDLLAKYQPDPKAKPKMYFTKLMDKLPSEHKAKWLAGAALNSSDQSMLSVMSTALSRLNSFLDSELEQMLCFGTAVDAEKFCNERSAIFIVLPEEDTSKYFMVSLLIQQLYREILVIADENGGKLKNRVMFYCDEFGTFPKIEGADLILSIILDTFFTNDFKQQGLHYHSIVFF